MYQTALLYHSVHDSSNIWLLSCKLIFLPGPYLGALQLLPRLEVKKLYLYSTHYWTSYFVTYCQSRCVIYVVYDVQYRVNVKRNYAKL